ncbi:MAG: hypothetical protein LQ340_007565 [Diploschistes diacapsis]|nr:MAG: hypothetical protein LQ340_007565 [Diploschistes diacapsis]
MADLEKTPNITLLNLDVTSPSSIAEALAAVKEKTGGSLDYLVNNSGSGYIMPVLDTDIATAKAMFDVNLWGLLAVTQAFAPLLIAAQGMIVNISSIAMMLQPTWMSLYAASKSAMDMTSEALRVEMEPLGVKVMTVVTGAVKTQIFANVPTNRLPESSVYRAAEAEIRKRMLGEDLPGSTSTAKFSRSVIKDVLASRTGHTYRGYLATVLHILVSILPASVMDHLGKQNMGLDKVKKSFMVSNNH